MVNTALAVPKIIELSGKAGQQVFFLQIYLYNLHKIWQHEAIFKIWLVNNQNPEEEFPKAKPLNAEDLPQINNEKGGVW